SRVTSLPSTVATHRSSPFCCERKAMREPSDEMAPSTTSIVVGWKTRRWISSQSMSVLAGVLGTAGFLREITEMPVGGRVGRGVDGAVTEERQLAVLGPADAGVKGGIARHVADRVLGRGARGGDDVNLAGEGAVQARVGDPLAVWRPLVVDDARLLDQRLHVG